MYIPWRNSSLKRAIQITGNLAKACRRLQVQVQLTRQEILQVTQELDELKSMVEVPGAIAMYHKYAALIDPYLQSYELDSCTSLAGEQKAAYEVAKSV